jgi:hypothetical protein
LLIGYPLSFCGNSLLLNYKGKLTACVTGSWGEKGWKRGTAKAEKHAKKRGAYRQTLHTLLGATLIMQLIL